jgi:hypothetical protein
LIKFRVRAQVVTRKSVESITEHLKEMVADLREHAGEQSDLQDTHAGLVEHHTGRAVEAQTEAIKARSVADKIEALING